MQNPQSLNALFIADGSGGHLIPALRAAHALAARGSRVTVWYAQRRQLAPLTDTLARQAQDAGIRIVPLPLPAGLSAFGRLWRCGQLWWRAQRSFAASAPDVVVGFGGWVSVPVVLAARSRGIRCLLHEQNVVMGRANRWLAPWVQRVALSFPESSAAAGRARSLVTGLPVRERIGQADRADAAMRFQLDASAPTVLILGGSQGATAVNRLLLETLTLLKPEERRRWQFLHVTGPADEGRAREGYAAAQVRAWTGAYLPDMELAYAQADLVVARAGASTIAELARCGLPALLIPYPHAGAHQRANAQMAEAAGGAVLLEEFAASPARLLATLRLILSDARLRTQMSRQMRQLARDDAADRLARMILEADGSTDGLPARATAPRTAPALAEAGR